MRPILGKVQALGRYIDVQYVVRYFSVLCFTLAFLNITQQYDTPYRFSVARGIQGEPLSAIICLDCPLTEKKPLHITMKPVYITNSNLH
jgi:hypothetical protein